MRKEDNKKPSRIRERNECAILEAAEIVFAQKGFGAATTAEIAKIAGIPKANLHYYFNTKEDLYLRVLENILSSWLTAAADFNSEHEPRLALERYIRTKMRLSQERPAASRIFAKEIISGAPFLKDHLRNDINPWLAEKTLIIKQWIDQGKMAPVDVTHLFFLIWGMTQTYADFSCQMEIVLQKDQLEAADFEAASDMICDMVFGLCKIH